MPCVGDQVYKEEKRQICAASQEMFVDNVIPEARADPSFVDPGV